MTGTATMNLSAYVEAVRVYLDAVPPEERGDLLEDLEQHLSEVAAESDEPLEQRLGSPAAYAAELLASAGYALRPPAKGPSVWARTRARADGLTRAFPELIPGWWVTRGLVAAGVLAVIVLDQQVADDTVFVALLAAVATVPASIWFGRQTSAGRWRWAAPVVSAAVVLAGFVALKDGRDDLRPAYYSQVVESPPPAGIFAANGRPVFNIYPFSADGTPLEGVLLYDQDGVPLDNVADVTIDGRQIQRQSPVRNSYPQSVLIPDEQTGQLRPDRRPTVVIPKVVETTTSTSMAP